MGQSLDAEPMRRAIGEMADRMADRLAYPRCPLPDDHPAMLPAGRLARWRLLATRRLRERERALAGRVHRWLELRYDLGEGA